MLFSMQAYKNEIHVTREYENTRHVTPFQVAFKVRRIIFIFKVFNKILTL